MTINSANLEKWTPEAHQLSESANPSVPHHVLLGEAVDVARFFRTHWATVRDEDGEIATPGLELAARKGLFHKKLGDEILELQDATQAAQTLYRLTVEESSGGGMDRAAYVLGELRTTLAFLFADDVEDADDIRLERLNSAHGQPTSQDAMATALEEYAAFADQNRERIGELGGFDVSVIDEAPELAKGLREISAAHLVGDTRTAQRDALDLRNRLATLLYERMQRVRAAARFVYRDDPEMVRRVTSTYLRQRRAKNRASNGVANGAVEASGNDTVDATVEATSGTKGVKAA